MVYKEKKNPIHRVWHFIIGIIIHTVSIHNIYLAVAQST